MVDKIGLDVDHLRFHVIRGTLSYLRMWSLSAENLLLGTALVESRLVWLRQFNNGPARGIYQIEPATHDDIVDRYLKHRSSLAKLVRSLKGKQPSAIDQLITNLAYATAIARLVYWPHVEPLPAADDVKGMAAYWKKFYHTYHAGGPGHTRLELESFATTYRRYVLVNATQPEGN